LGLCASAGIAHAAEVDKSKPLYILTPLVSPEVPSNGAQNPIDAFLDADYQAKSLQPAGPADKATLLRRVYLDLIGIPPTPAEQDAFIKDTSSDAYEKVVDKLLSNEQHGVRYARHWLDVLRYADVDERMVAAPGIYLWRDWMINALNDDIPYDQFVRVQLTGYRTAARTQISATGYRSKLEPRPDDQFALGLLARGQVLRDGKDGEELAISAVETVSTAFMGLTVGCAKCHDHKFDPISKRDFYQMKALFDPLTVRKLYLASPQDIFAAGKATDDTRKRQAAAQAPVVAFAAPYKRKLYEDRIAMLPAEAQEVIRKPESERTVAEQKIADDYYPIVRIDEDRIVKAMPPDARREYAALKRKAGEAGQVPADGTPTLAPVALPAFWTVEVDASREAEKSYILTSGDPLRPEMDHPVEPGWPFAPKKIDFHDGRVEAFSDWLTAPENPMFARVAMNRLWQWHFGEGLEKTTSDFGRLATPVADTKLLDWLASEFVRRGFSMKQMNRLIVTSDVYRRASAASSEQIAANQSDPANLLLWHFRLERLDAEPIWDSIMTAAGSLDVSVGGPSFDVGVGGGGRGRRGGARRAPTGAPGTVRRAAYMIRGFSTSRDVVPVFLQAFDVDDGRVPCPLRTQTVTAPQGLFMMNSDQVEQASAKFAERLKKDSAGDNTKAVELAYRMTLGRSPSDAELKRSLDYIGDNPDRLKSFAWIMFNLDEFIYVK
jgi:hypothetical protein